jgi:hypothetical protein
MAPSYEKQKKGAFLHIAKNASGICLAIHGQTFTVEILKEFKARSLQIP